ncbi:putative low-specificity L-threonine aldolase 2 [Armadillidium nasatum]|uniref:Putative low-specificity L-threonine aldolase 2 n=1 Tax=Armadillidium nasatum TaxID=96803 RepID=A0A5N5SNN8_9CRUS|nr:putative low-specificity L-threonine aldolase 2 [Armadillidium nasatum]
MPLLNKFRNIALLSKSYHMKPQINPLANCLVDLRSDTVTKPCIGMRQAMKEADVGDDVFQEDKTVLELEQKMAEMTQKDDGLFVLSGTMGNLLSILSHCGRRGAEIIVGNNSHIFTYEQANMAQFGGVQPHTVETNSDGTFSIDALKSCIRKDDFHLPTTELICLENTHGNLGGKALPLKWLDEVAEFAKYHGLPIHVDGARIFNASIASQVPVSQLLRVADSTSICLSKGLGCPVGSVIVGNHQFIKRARRLRKALGGAWRQGGILAAAGIYSLENNVAKLAKDHENARLIAKGNLIIIS